MTNYETTIMNGTNVWAKACIAHKHNAWDALTHEELQEVIAGRADRDFYAEMSDDYSVTRAEKRTNREVTNAAVAELETR